MKTPITLLGLAVAVAIGVTATVSLVSAPSRSEQPAPAAAPDPLERGHYLVHRVGMCTDCHSPRNEKGEFIPTKLLAGAPISFAPTVPMPWMPVAPRLAGLPLGFKEEELVNFLMTGERPHGRPPALPPMPAYRFNREDASAIVAYLRSLPAEPAE